ncbi:hypothetical protein QR680_010141 [Steinernema hermaphroditum]|uniref:Uncharacterized protein n=1 Tax=Steinernema hermaphroditum TaxID=289476 RepID=A0AA39MB07_9BILA|nr:hypothetical protein QR680_010141 [Steinernema hermaphroditum]
MDSLAVLYSQLLDVSAVGSFTIKPLSIIVIVFYTPKHLRTTSYFILNEMIWNLAGNLLFTAGHPFPVLPTQCIRLDGVVSYVAINETMRHIFFLLILVTAINCNIGLLTTFQFRYMAIAYKDLMTVVKPIWGYVYCVILHVICTILFSYLMINASTSTEEYSKNAHLESTENIFCFKSYGWEKSLLMWCFFISMLVFMILLVTYTFLCLRELRKQEHFMEPTTLAIQRTVLRNLMIMTAVPVVLGCFPLFIASFFIQFNDWPYAEEIVAISYVFVSNHGTVYSVFTLVLFKSYRVGVQKLFNKLAMLFLRLVLGRNSPRLNRTKVVTIGMSSRRV